MGAIEPFALEIFDTGRPIFAVQKFLVVENDTCRQSVVFDVQVLRVAPGDIEDSLPNAAALMTSRRKRRIAEPLRALAKATPIVWIGLSSHQTPDRGRPG